MNHKKPAIVKLLENNPGGRPIEEEVEAVGDLSEMPEWFDDEQKLVWDYTMKHAPKGVLKFIDQSAMVAYCVAVATHKEATLRLGREGFVETSARETTKRSEWFHIQAKAAEQMLKYAAEMGFTPASRSKVFAGSGQDKKANEFANNGRRKKA